MQRWFQTAHFSVPFNSPQPVIKNIKALKTIIFKATKLKTTDL